MLKNITILPAKLAVFFLFYLFFATADAQQYAKIKLQNNAYLKGKIVKGFDSTGVIVEINGNTSRIPMSNIKSIKISTRQSSPGNVGESMEFDGSFSQFERGYFHSLGLGLISGADQAEFSATVINGYRFNPLMNAGLGIGYNNYNSITTLPIFAEYRAYPMQQKFCPYLYSHLGYGFRVEAKNRLGFETTKSKGGLYWALGAGYQINFLNTALAFSAGYVSQTAATAYESQPGWGSPSEYEEKRTMGRVDLKVHLIF